MNLDAMALLQRWEQMMSAAWHEVLEEDGGRVGYAEEDTPDLLVRRIFREGRRGRYHSLNLLELRRSKHLGTTSFSRCVMRRTPWEVQCAEGQIQESPEGYALETASEGYSYSNAGGRDSWEAEVYLRFQEDFHKRWDTLRARFPRP
jgi:hypothetical protein